jgi:hypothetical protein
MRGPHCLREPAMTWMTGSFVKRKLDGDEISLTAKSAAPSSRLLRRSSHIHDRLTNF